MSVKEANAISGKLLRLGRDRGRRLLRELIEEGKLVQLAPQTSRKKQLIHRDAVAELTVMIEGEKQHSGHTPSVPNPSESEVRPGSGRLYVRNTSDDPITDLEIRVENGEDLVLERHHLASGECAEISDERLKGIISERLSESDMRIQNAYVVGLLSEDSSRHANLSRKDRERMRHVRLIVSYNIRNSGISGALDLHYRVMTGRWERYNSMRFPKGWELA